MTSVSSENADHFPQLWISCKKGRNKYSSEEEGRVTFAGMDYSYVHGYLYNKHTSGGWQVFDGQRAVSPHELSFLPSFQYMSENSQCTMIQKKNLMDY